MIEFLNRLDNLILLLRLLYDPRELTNLLRRDLQTVARKEYLLADQDQKLVADLLVDELLEAGIIPLLLLKIEHSVQRLFALNGLPLFYLFLYFNELG